MWLSLRKIFQRQPPSSDAALTLELLEVLEECDTKQQVVVSQQLRRLLVVNVTHCEREVTLVKTKDVTQLVHRACSLEVNNFDFNCPFLLNILTLFSKVAL